MLKSSFYILKLYYLIFLGISLANLLVNGIRVSSSFQIMATLLFVLLMAFTDVLWHFYNHRGTCTCRTLVIDVILDTLVLPRFYEIWRKERGIIISHEGSGEVINKANLVFLVGVGLGVFSFCMFVLLSAYYYHSLPSTGGGASLPINASHVGSFIRQILFHNLLILVDIVLGGFTGMFLTLKVLYTNGLSAGVITSLTLSGRGNVVLPHGILELFALAISTGTSALVFSTLWISFVWKYEDRDTYIGLLMRLLLRIGVSFALSVFMILIAANVEYSNILFLLGKVAKPSAWYAWVYVGDGLLLIASLLTLIDAFLFERLYAPSLFDRFFFPFLFMFSILNAPAPLDRMAKLMIFGSLMTSIYVLSRQIVESVVTYLLRPRPVPGSDFILTLVQGTSMNPTIFEGDVVVISRKVPGKLEPGMILDVRIPLRYMSRARNFIHRLVWTDGRAIQTKGDNLRHLDPKMPVRNVEGVAVAVLRESNGGFQVEPLVDDPKIPREVVKIAGDMIRRHRAFRTRTRLVGIYLPLFVTGVVSIVLLALN
ncbi:stage II sporulation protein M [Thermococcus gorgonarius]|uniref:Signal peptidase I n=1 Tax=Thermococcus gorgonarius TaxID=71997 RepID=A0A2Z2MFN4_THEGO|nr:stage II sporulation protein M [Thermococcus gorgonarius]ASJ01261.1 hypothetical protein A3K92_07095 [Thermococcus gorgonarius]